MSAIEEVLRQARRGWSRVTARDAWQEVRAGRALLIDTRTESQRRAVGELPGAIVIDRTVLEWRVDPTVDTCISEARSGPRLIVICRQGYSSSLAVASLRGLGLDATDVVGGVEAWAAAGLPFSEVPGDVRE